MTEMQREMQNRISQEELDRAAFERWGSHHHYIKGYMK